MNFLEICEFGDMEEAMKMIEEGTNTRDVDSEGNTALHLSTDQFNREISTYLLENNLVDIDTANSCGNSALHLACLNQDEEAVELLLRFNTNVNAQNLERITPLHMAAATGNVNIVASLIEAGADISISVDSSGCTALHDACNNGSAEVARILIEHGADLDAKNEYDNTPLHRCCSNGHTEAAMLLIDRGAKVDAQGVNARYPLHYAAANGHVEIMKCLLDKGADLNVFDSRNFAPLHRACNDGHEAAAEFLIDQGVDLNAISQEGSTVLHIACRSSLVNIVKILLNRNVDVNAKDKWGKTPLHVACDNHKMEIVVNLVENGADIHAKDARQSTPLHVACSCGDMEVATFLVREGADIYASNEYRELPTVNEEIKTLFHQLWYPTPLTQAVHKGNLEEFVTLIDSEDCNVNEDIGSGWTVLHVAACLNRVEFVEKLLSSHLLMKDASSSATLQSALRLACSRGNLGVVKLLGHALIQEAASASII